MPDSTWLKILFLCGASIRWLGIEHGVTGRGLHRLFPSSAIAIYECRAAQTLIRCLLPVPDFRRDRPILHRLAGRDFVKGLGRAASFVQVRDPRG
jgi:hypothetical protein